MLTFKSKMNNAATHRHIDQNGYLFVDESPILASGVLEYYGHELGEGEIGGLKIEPDKLYRVYLPPEELEKAKDTFTLLPLTNNHQWLGVDGKDAKDYQEGTTGEQAQVRGGMLYVPLKFTSADTVEQITNGEKEELSASYENRLIRSQSGDYDFVAVDLKGNHVALVDKGRCGDKVRVLNNKEKNQMKTKAKNNAKLILNGKEIDLDKFLNEEQAEGEHDESIKDTVKDETETENTDKRALIDEIGGILKGKVDEELWRTIIGKAEKLAYTGSEASKSDNEGCVDDNKTETQNEDAEEDEKEKKDDDEKDASKTFNYDAVYSKISNAIRKEFEEKEKACVRAYNEASSVLGAFNAFGLSARDIYVKALNAAGIPIEGKESVAELRAMLRACSSVRAKVDNSFAYGATGAKEEIEVNI